VRAREYLLRAARLDLAYYLAAFIDCRTTRPPARLDAIKRALAKHG